MSFLLDTDICSALLKGDGGIASRLLQHTGRLNTSIVTVAELYVWALASNAPSRRPIALRHLLDEAPPLLVDDDVARVYGITQARLIENGQKAPEMDLLIAATALAHDLTLVTHNIADFQGIPDLRLVDWLAP